MKPLPRRDFLKSSGLALGALAAGGCVQQTAEAPPATDHPPHYPAHVLDLKKHLPDPVVVRSFAVLKTVGETFLTATSDDGLTGITLLNFRMAHFMPVMQQLLIPFFEGKDARGIEALVDHVLHQRTVYKYSGIPLFNALGHIEICLMDLLGKAAGMPAGLFFGEKTRSSLPMYVSSLTRETSPEQEVENLGKQLAETGSKALKVKVGGRMSKNKDAAPGRTEQLIPLLRKHLGDSVTIYADANSSFDVAEGIRTAAFLEDHGVAIFEEPCYWEDYAANKKVADTLKTMKLAGGEQDTSYLRFREIIENRVYHIVQPDVYYNGGMLRTWYVGQMAAAHGMGIAPHSPKADPLAAPFFQFASVAPKLEGFQEHPGGKKKFPDWYQPHFDIADGMIKVPDGPGLGLEYDADIWKNAEKL